MLIEGVHSHLPGLLRIVAGAALLSAQVIGASQAGASVTPVDKGLPDYSYAGYGFGLPPLPTDSGTVIEAADFGVIPNDGKDDAKALLKALAAAEAIDGKVTVRLPQGRVQIGEIIPITRSNLVLEGAGDKEGGTELYFPRPLKIVDTSNRQAELRAYLLREDKYQREPDQNIDFLFSEYSWSGGFLLVGRKDGRSVSYDGTKDQKPRRIVDAVSGKQFERTLTVKTSAALTVGQVVQVQWFSDNGPESSILKSLYGDLQPWNDRQTDPAMKLSIGSHHWTFPKRPVVAQSTRITAIKGNRITIGDPLLHDVRADQPASLADWPHLTNVGIQNVRLVFPMSPWFGHHLEQGFNGIYFTSVFDGWIKDVTIENSDNGILTDDAASLTIANVTTRGDHKAHYAVHVGAVHNVLVTGLRVENPVVHPLTVNTRSTRSVYHRVEVLRDGIIDQHSGSNHQNLFDAVTIHVRPTSRKGGEPEYQLWQSGGAPYWKPGHGLHNTQWNLQLVFPETDDQRPVHLTSGLEGPGANLVGIHGNRAVTVSYKPDPRVALLNQAPRQPSLYEYQLAKRRRGAR